MSDSFCDSNLSDQQWLQVEILLPPVKPVGRQREFSVRQL